MKNGLSNTPKNKIKLIENYVHYNVHNSLEKILTARRLFGFSRRTSALKRTERVQTKLYDVQRSIVAAKELTRRQDLRRRGRKNMGEEGVEEAAGKFNFATVSARTGAV